MHTLLVGSGSAVSSVLLAFALTTSGSLPTEKARADIESRLHARHVTSLDRDRLLPVFTNRDAFLRSTGMSNTDHAWVLVIGRDGQVLAKVQGHYHHDKAQALRETLVASNSLVF